MSNVFVLSAVTLKHKTSDIPLYLYTIAVEDVEKMHSEKYEIIKQLRKLNLKTPPSFV